MSATQTLERLNTAININGTDFLPSQVIEDYCNELEERIARLEKTIDATLGKGVMPALEDEFIVHEVKVSPKDETNSTRKSKSLQQLSKRKLPRIPKLAIKNWRKPQDMVSEFLSAYDPSGEFHGEMAHEILAQSELGLKYKKNLMLDYDEVKKPTQYKKRWEKIESELQLIAKPGA